MAKLILVRHGQTNWDKEKRVQGTLDIPLNNEGEKDAQKLAAELSKLKIDTLYSSPAACSLSTANEIASCRKLKVKKRKEFSELNHGVWRGLLVKDVKKRYKKQYNAWKSSPTSVTPPNGESTKDACDRTISAVRKLTDKHKGENICIVSHDIALSLIKCYFKSMDVEKMWEFIPGKTRWESIEI